VHDILTLDSRGIPGCAVASEEFQVAAAAQIKALGCEPALVWVDHPIQNRTDTELAQMASAAVTQILAKICVPEPA
jgi:hypothetical protein